MEDRCIGSTFMTFLARPELDLFLPGCVGGFVFYIRIRLDGQMLSTMLCTGCCSRMRLLGCPWVNGRQVEECTQCIYTSERQQHRL